MDKIAEIRERVGMHLMPLGATSKLENQLIRDVRYLLSELERAQSENNSLKWQMDELANMPWVELEKENRKLREERDNAVAGARAGHQAIYDARKEIERLTTENVRVVAMSGAGYDKLVEGLRDISTYPPFDETNNGERFYEQMRELSRKLLAEIGMTE